MLGNQTKISPVSTIKSQVVNTQPCESGVRKLRRNPTVPFDNRKIHDASQQPSGDPWRAA